MGLVIPGDFVSEDSFTYSCGSGTFKDANNTIRSLKVGNVFIDNNTKVMSVVSFEEKCTQIPQVGCIIIGKCVRITQRFAAIDIEAILNNTFQPLPLVTPIKGTIRLQDIYPVEELETPKIQDCFRPGDIVRAKVIGWGDPSAGLLLSTGMGVELGVLYATNSNGQPLSILSWNEMLDTHTGQREKRKCAKPV